VSIVERGAWAILMAVRSAQILVRSALPGLPTGSRAPPSDSLAVHGSLLWPVSRRRLPLLGAGNWPTGVDLATRGAFNQRKIGAAKPSGRPIPWPRFKPAAACSAWPASGVGAAELSIRKSARG
jgi:hypothetical protein